jgi:arabinose-5-phosphate isomerase
MNLKVYDCIKIIRTEHIRDHMYLNPPTASFETPIDEVIKKIVSGRFRTLIILEKKIPVGIITDSDIIQFIKPVYSGVHEREYFRLLRQTAGEYMTKNPVLVKEDKTIEEALLLMENFNITRLIVVNEKNELTGLITIRKIISDAIGIDLKSL